MIFSRFKKEDFIKILNANKIFIKNLDIILYFFLILLVNIAIIKEYISKNFKFSFGQHSGVIDINKDQYELPRFPINEKYGDLKRFKFLINLIHCNIKILYLMKNINNKNNPPKFSVEFFKEQKNLNNINCFSDEGNKWEKSNII